MCTHTCLCEYATHISTSHSNSFVEGCKTSINFISSLLLKFEVRNSIVEMYHSKKFSLFNYVHMLIDGLTFIFLELE